MNEFSIITPENNLKFQYPIISVQFVTKATSSGGRDEKPLCYRDAKGFLRKLYEDDSKKNFPCQVKY